MKIQRDANGRGAWEEVEVEGVLAEVVELADDDDDDASAPSATRSLLMTELNSASIESRLDMSSVCVTDVIFDGWICLKHVTRKAKRDYKRKIYNFD